jgi:hypothetical protein
MPPRPRVGRKVLIASIGVATLNYAGISCGGAETSGNLAPPPADGAADQGVADATHGHDAVDDFPVANLVAMPDVIEDRPVANLAAPPDVIDDFPVANLVAPPMDAGPDGGDAGD